MAATLPSVCTAHSPLRRSPNSPGLARRHLPVPENGHEIILRSWKISKYDSRPWRGLISTGCGNEHLAAQLKGKKKQGLCSRVFFDFFSCGVDDHAPCCSSRLNWDLPSSITHAVVQGIRSARTHGLASESCELVTVGGYTRTERFKKGKAWTRRHRRKRFTNGVLEDRQSSYETAVDTFGGGHPSLSESTGSTVGHVLLETVVETSLLRKRLGWRRRVQFSPTSKCGMFCQECRGIRAKNVPVAFSFTTQDQQNRSLRHICCCSSDEHSETKLTDSVSEEESVDNVGVQIALALLRFYKREISPCIPASCRYVPTCSEYAQQAYRKYGFVKGSILTAWRLARCNPLGSSGFDPPRWFGEEKPPQL